MRRSLIIVTLVCLNSLTALAQSWTFARDGVEYVIDLPSATWRVVSRVDVHEHMEFVNGNDEVNGYLRLTKIPVSYTHLRAHETPEHLVCRLLLEKKKR